MRIKKINLCWVIFLCLITIGCHRKSEEQQVDVSDDITMEKTNKTGEVVDMETSDTLEEEVTVISILDKEEIAIENERIYDERYGLEQLNNLFTLDEINTILNTIKGTWEADEYVGFVSYDMYGRGKWIDSGDEDKDATSRYVDDSEWEAYQKDQERASANIPDFTISIKQYNTIKDGIENIDNNYIYIQTDDGRCYDSPMSIVLSMNYKDDDYPVFINRSLVGYGTQDNYPVIYIQFFSIRYSEEEDAVVYEPATLILTSDGQFLLLKDGAFYTLKKNIQSEIMSGNFECLSASNEYIEDIEEVYKKSEEDVYFLEWRQVDLNGDGIQDLILQDWYGLFGSSSLLSYYGNKIYGIFICGEDEATCIWWDNDDDTEYYNCGRNTGELIYTVLDYEGAVSTEQYSHCYVDEEWNLITDYTLVVYCIDSTVDKEDAEEWQQEHPDMAEDGLYYRKYTEEGEEILTREELENIYETVTGYEFYSEFY